MRVRSGGGRLVCSVPLSVSAFTNRIFRPCIDAQRQGAHEHFSRGFSVSEAVQKLRILQAQGPIFSQQQRLLVMLTRRLTFAGLGRQVRQSALEIGIVAVFFHPALRPHEALLCID